MPAPKALASIFFTLAALGLAARMLAAPASTLTSGLLAAPTFVTCILDAVAATGRLATLLVIRLLSQALMSAGHRRRSWSRS